MSDPAIIVSGLARGFSGREVLRDLFLEVQRGEVVALVGANGSGKSTLLEILATLLFPTAGRATVHGFDVVAEPVAVRRLVGYCPSNLQSFYPRLSGRRNLEFFATLYGLDSHASRTRTGALLDRVGLMEAARERVERYSDGMKARLCIARALLTDAPVLLLDEPTKSLDAAGRDAMRSLILGDTQQARPRTTVWVTHDMDEAVAVSNRVGILDGGRIRHEASVLYRPAANL